MRARRETGDFATLARQLGKPRRSNWLMLSYHWRYELAAVVLVPLALIALADAIGLIWTLVVLCCVANGVYHWPAARRFVRTRLRIVVVQHRLRSAFTAARVCTVDGRRPAILWTSRVGDHIRVVLFCPAGLGVDRIREHSRVLAAACFANDVVVARHPRRAHLVELTIRRR